MIRSDAIGESVRQPVRNQSHEDGRMRWRTVRFSITLPNSATLLLTQGLLTVIIGPLLYAKYPAVRSTGVLASCTMSVFPNRMPP